MPWSLLATAPNSEFAVARRLARFGFEHLLIKRRTIRIWHGQKIERLRAAFPRYLFIIANEAWETIREITGVIDFVRIGITPAIISQETIDSLRSRLDRQGVLPVIEKSRFNFGERVVVTGANVLSGHQALFQYAIGRGRVCLLQEWMGQYVPVEIDERDVMSLPEYRAFRKSKHRRRKRHRSQRYHMSRPQPAQLEHSGLH